MLEIEEKLQAEQARGLEALQAVTNVESLEAWKQEFLGKSSLVMKAFGSMGQLAKEERPLVGRAVNQVRSALEAALAEREEGIKAASQQEAFTKETLDVTLPGRKPRRGRIHPLHLTLREIYKIFGDMGFQIYRSPEVETDDYNFTFLNMPPYHPARDMWDTFYTDKEGVLLRTHTSPGQVRVMRERAPENIRVILPGTTMRYEQLTARSEIEFIQVELLVVGKGITFADMRGTLNDFARRTFGAHARTRLRPSFFPFTEPSAEMDVECFVCGGEGCGVCKGTGWLEILGCGMVHPTVLRYGGYDPEVYSGFAAGMGIDRSTLMRYHIDDIRHFRNNDIRFLEQF
jgi:phenylalanyl-tRNA synthetase alpha chain